MEFDEVFWHDGQIQSLSILCNKQDGSSYQILLGATVYSNMECLARIPITVKFDNVTNIVASCNFLELIDNFCAGNISNGYKKGDASYILYLVDGYIEITAGKIDIIAS